MKTFWSPNTAGDDEKTYSLGQPSAGPNKMNTKRIAESELTKLFLTVRYKSTM